MLILSGNIQKYVPPRRWAYGPTNFIHKINHQNHIRIWTWDKRFWKVSRGRTLLSLGCCQRHSGQIQWRSPGCFFYLWGWSNVQSLLESHNLATILFIQMEGLWYLLWLPRYFFVYLSVLWHSKAMICFCFLLVCSCLFPSQWPHLMHVLWNSWCWVRNPRAWPDSKE